VADLQHFAADLCSTGHALATTGTTDKGGSLLPAAQIKGLEKAYLGGRSNVWRPFLEHIAANAPSWVDWTDLCKHIDRVPEKASGMLGAAERRMKNDGISPPYEKKHEGPKTYFRMSVEVAEVIKTVAKS